MGFLTKFEFIFLVGLNFVLIINGQDVCVKKGPCTCVFSNGTGIDLSPSSKSTFYSAQSYSEKKAGKQLELHTYYYHPCYDLMPPVNNTSTNDTCTVPLALCRHLDTLNSVIINATEVYKMDPGVNNYLGSVNSSEFSANGDSIIYHNGPSETIVLLNCAETEDKLHVFSLDEPNKIALSFYSRSACLKMIEEGGRSLGSTLLIVFFSLVIFYLVLGVCTKKFLMGATGIEVIPNLGFWNDLPNLVKDGWAFTANGFKLPVRGSGPALSPDPNSYDSI